MRTLVGNAADYDSVVLINQGEVLTRDGIQGKIATIGVGFGTGRHTMLRKSPPRLPSESSEKKLMSKTSIKFRKNTSLNATSSNFITRTTKTDYKLSPKRNLPEVRKPKP